LLLAFPKITFLKGFYSPKRVLRRSGGYFIAQTFAITPPVIADSIPQSATLATRSWQFGKLWIGRWNTEDRCKMKGMEKSAYPLQNAMGRPPRVV
jgi:hypothetical protein